jgi:hypothetical protein
MITDLLFVGYTLVAGSNKSSHYDHRLIQRAVGSAPVQPAWYKQVVLSCAGKSRSTEIAVCAVGQLLVLFCNTRGAGKGRRSTETNKRVSLLYKAIWCIRARKAASERGRRENGRKEK